MSVGSCQPYSLVSHSENNAGLALCITSTACIHTKHCFCWVRDLPGCLMSNNLQSFTAVTTMPWAKTKPHKTEIGSYKRAFKSPLAALNRGKALSSQKYISTYRVSVASLYSPGISAFDHRYSQLQKSLFHCHRAYKLSPRLRSLNLQRP